MSEKRKKYSLEDRVDRVLNYLQYVHKEPLTNAIKFNAEAGETIDILQQQANLVIGAADSLRMVNKLSKRDKDFLGIAQAKILSALFTALGVKGK